MANESAVYQFVASLKQKLEARLVPPAWPNTTVYTIQPMEKVVTLDDCVILVRGRVLAPQAYATNVRNRDQEIQLPMLVNASAVNSADPALAALQRADQLLGEVVAQLRDDPPDAGDIPIIGQRKAVVSNAEFYPYPKDAGGWGVGVYFTVTTSVRVA